MGKDHGIRSWRGAVVFELIRFRPSLVHLHASADASFVRKGILFWISQLAGVAAVLHIHDSGFPDYYDNSPRAIQVMIRATLCRASAVVALGDECDPAAGDCANRADHGDPQCGSTGLPGHPARTG